MQCTRSDSPQDSLSSRKNQTPDRLKGDYFSCFTLKHSGNKA